MKITHALAAGLAVMAFAACEVPEDSGTAADRTDTKNAAKEKAQDVDAAAADKDKKDKPKAEKPKETPGQANARESAETYLDMTGFSRKG